MLQTFQATRYLVALREGGSLPAVLDTDGGGLYVAKFRGAGQGARALIGHPRRRDRPGRRLVELGDAPGEASSAFESAEAARDAYATFSENDSARALSESVPTN